MRLNLKGPKRCNESNWALPGSTAKGCRRHNLLARAKALGSAQRVRKQKTKGAPKRSSKRGSPEKASESEGINNPLLVAHIRDVSTDKYWNFDCRALVPGTIVVLAPEKMPPPVGQCMVQGPPLQNLKVNVAPGNPSPFGDMWYGCNSEIPAKCLFTTYSSSAPEQEPELVVKDLAVITSLVQKRLADIARTSAISMLQRD